MNYSDLSVKEFVQLGEFHRKLIRELIKCEEEEKTYGRTER